MGQGGTGTSATVSCYYIHTRGTRAPNQDAAGIPGGLWIYFNYPTCKIEVNSVPCIGYSEYHSSTSWYSDDGRTRARARARRRVGVARGVPPPCTARTHHLRPSSCRAYVHGCRAACAKCFTRHDMFFREPLVLDRHQSLPRGTKCRRRHHRPRRPRSRPTWQRPGGPRRSAMVCQHRASLWTCGRNARPLWVSP